MTSEFTKAMKREAIKKVLDTEIKGCNNEIAHRQNLIKIDTDRKEIVKISFKWQRVSHVANGSLIGTFAGLGAELANAGIPALQNADPLLPFGAAYLSSIAVGTMAGYLNYRLRHKKQMTKERDKKVDELNANIEENVLAMEHFRQIKEEKESEKQAILKYENEMCR